MTLPQSDRQIRVFISSTFRDMTAERDHLVKFIFPQLCKLCESRGVTWGEVDLRWGVTDEQAAEGKVLPICLEEIKRCRPYFIGLLGERYGWIPETFPDDLLEREPWLKEHLHGKTSVTELEILHGVLRDEQMHEHAFFYFREPKYVEQVPVEKRLDFSAENTECAEKLKRLKEEIRHAHTEKICQLRENYPDPKALGELVLADLTRVINELFPEGSQPDPLDREAMDHEAYAQSRERVYIGRQEYFNRLDIHAAGREDHPLVVIGESGSGKSALLANWVARYRQAHPDALVLQHYIGAAPYSADWAAMLRRLMGEFKRRLGLQQDIPDQPDALHSAFPNWLYMAAAKGRVVLVFDALNQLEDRDGAPDLVWLPPVLPENVRLIVSTLPGRPLDEIQKRSWPTLKVELLSADERRKLIAEYLAQHAKSLNAARVERIANAPPSANPLYLRVLLDELRLVRTHEELEERIGDYLKAESPYALYEKVIARWEQDYEDDSDLVGDTLSLLWAARRGLTETELLQAMGKDGEPLARAKWSPLFLAMSDVLVSRGGLLTFAHDFLRTAVKNAYLPTDQNQQQAHLRLANYFECRIAGPRRTDELPWQLAEARDWQRLYDLLTNHVFFIDAWSRNEFDIKSFWVQIEDGSPLRMVAAYSAQIEHPHDEGDKEYLWELGSLLEETGHLDESISIRSALGEYFKHSGDLNRLQMALNNKAVILLARGNLDEAMALHKSGEQLFRQTGDQHRLATCLGNQAIILRRRGDLDGAFALLLEKIAICRQLRDLQGLLSGLVEQATILRLRGDLDQAMSIFKEEEQVLRALSDRKRLADCLGQQGLILKALGDLDQAMELHKKEEGINRQLGSLDGLSVCLGNQGTILVMRGNLDGAMTLFIEKEQICRQLGDQDGLSLSLGNQANICFARKNPRAAAVLFKEAEQIMRHLGNLHELQRNLNNQASMLSTIGELNRAMELVLESVQIARQLRSVEGLAGATANQALILNQMGNTSGALLLAEEAYRLATDHGYAALARQIAPILNRLGRGTQNKGAGKSAAAAPTSSPSESPGPPRDLTIPQLRDSAATALKRGIWEAAQTYLEKLLQQGEPVDTVAPDLITALLSAHETVSPHTVTRIETLLAQLDSAGHTALAASLREKLTAKLAASQPKKPWWKFGK